MIISTFVISVPGWLLNAGIISSGDGTVYGFSNIGAASAIHEIKVYAAGLNDRKADGYSATGNMNGGKNGFHGNGQGMQGISGGSAASAGSSASDNTADSETGVSGNAVSGNLETSADQVPEEDPEHPVYRNVDDSYFKDALFIGDSRTKGFGLYSKLDTTVYAATGFQIYEFDSKKIVPTVFGNMTVPEALGGGIKYQKIYLMFGLNEMGWGTEEMFDEDYYHMIDTIKALQPDAVIYVQSIIHVTAAKSASSDLYNNSAIDARNEHLKEIAKNEHVYYLNLNEVFTDVDNCMPSEYSLDGVHVIGSYINLWVDYLKSHAIVREGMTYSGSSDAVSGNSVSQDQAVSGQISGNVVSADP